MSQCRQKDKTKKGATTGIGRDVATLRAAKGEKKDGEEVA